MLGIFGRKVIISTAFLFSMQLAYAQDSWKSLNKLKEKARDATLVVKLTPLRIHKGVLKEVKSKEGKGHGVKISVNGVIYTAAHVIVPTVAWMKDAGAHTYRVTVEHTDVWTGDKTTASVEAIAYKTDAFIGTETVPCLDDIKIRCLENDVISAHQDFAMLASGHETSSFVDLLGKWDDLVKKSGAPDIVATVARFKDGEILPDTIDTDGWDWLNYRLTREKDLWRVAGNKSYHCGISGAPLIGFFNGGSAQKDAISVIGVVNNGLPWRAKTPSVVCDGSNVFFAAIFQYHDKQDNIYKFLRSKIGRQTTPWNCNSGTNSHSPNSALAEYFTLQENSVFNDNQKSKSIDCFDALPTWDFTATIELTDKNFYENFVKNTITDLWLATHGVRLLSPGVDVNCFRLAGDEFTTCLKTKGTLKRELLATTALENLNKKNIGLDELIEIAKTSNDEDLVKQAIDLEKNTFIHKLLNPIEHQTLELVELNEKNQKMLGVLRNGTDEAISSNVRFEAAIQGLQY